MDIEKERRKLRFQGKYKVLKNACWEWQCGKYHKSNGSYGMFYWGVIKGKEVTIQAHRAAWIILRGPIPKKNIVCHKCNYPTCVNPDHLYLGTHKTNAEDRVPAGTQRRTERMTNWKRTAGLLDGLKQSFREGLTVAQVMEKHNIGWQTVYRAREQDADLKAVMAETKFTRYSAASKRRWVT